MKIKTFILTFLLAMSCPFLFGQSRDGEAVITDLLSLKNAITSSVGSEDPVVAYLDNSVKGITESIVVPEGANFCLDLNNFTLESSSNVYVFKNLGKLQIIDRSQYKKGTIKTKGIENGDGKLNAQLTMENVTFKNAEGTNGGALVYNKVAAKATIDGGSYEGNNIALLNYGVMNVTNVARIEGKSQNFKIYEGSTLNISKSYIYGNYYQLIGSATVGTTADDEVIEGEGVMFVKATVGGKPYASLHDAVVAANDKADAETNQTVELLYDVVETQIVEAKFVGTINGNNKKLTSTAERAINVNVACADDEVVTINDLIIATKDNEYFRTQRAINVINDANLELNNVSAEGFKYTINVTNNGAGSTITTNGGKYSGYAAVNITANNTTFKSYNTEFVGVNNVPQHESNNFAAIAVNYPTTENVTININGGKVSATSTTGNRQFIATVENTTKSTITIDAELAPIDNDIFNGDFEGENTIAFRDGYADELLAQGYTFEGDEGNEGLVAVTGIAIAKIDDTYYTSLKDALVAVTNDQKIEIVANNDEGTLTYPITDDNEYAINFSITTKEGFEYEFAESNYELVFNSGVKVTFVDANIKGIVNSFGNETEITLAGNNNIKTLQSSNGGTYSVAEGEQKIGTLQGELKVSGEPTLAIEEAGVGSKLVINGATLNDVLPANIDVTVAQGENNVINTAINGGNFVVAENTAVTVNADMTDLASLTVNGTMNAEANVKVNTAEGNTTTINGKFSISGEGKVASIYRSVTVGGKVNVNAGATFTQSNKNYSFNLNNGAEINVAEGSVITVGAVKVAAEAAVALKFKGNASFKSTTNAGTINLYMKEGTTFTTNNIDDTDDTDGVSFVATTDDNCEIFYEEGAYKAIRILNDGDVAMIGKVGYPTLQAAIDAAVDGDVITLRSTIEECVTVTQTKDVKITIDGQNETEFKGTITVDGKSAACETAALTVKGITFIAENEYMKGKDAVIQLGISGNSETRYTNYVTIENCTFKGIDKTKVAVKNYTGGCKNITITGCVVEGMHSLAQFKNNDGITIEDCKICESANGMSLDASSITSISECIINVEKYGIRVNASEARNTTIKDCEITAYIPVIARSAKADYTFNFEGTNKMEEKNEDGKFCVIDGKDNKYEDGNVELDDLTPATGKVVVNLIDENLSYNGVYGNYYVAKIGETQYQSLELALQAVKDGQTIEIIAEGTESNVVYPAADAEEGKYAKEFAIKSVGEGANYQVSVLFQKDVNVDLTDAVIYDLRSFEDAVISLNNTTVNGMLYSKNNKAEVTGNVTINKLYSVDGQDGAINVTGITNLVVKQSYNNPTINMTDVTLGETTSLPGGIKVVFENENNVNKSSLKGNIVFNNGTTTFDGASLTGSVNVKEGATVKFTENTYLYAADGAHSVYVSGILNIEKSGAWVRAIIVAQNAELNITGRNEITNQYLGENDLDVRTTITNNGTITVNGSNVIIGTANNTTYKLDGEGTLTIAGTAKVDASKVAIENIANTILLNGKDAKFYARAGLTNVKDIQGLLEPKYENGYYSLAGEFVAQVGNNKYRTFSSALDAAIKAEDKTITLLDDITPIDLTATIDACNGVTINVTTGDKELFVEGEITVNSGTLVFDNAKLVQEDANFDIEVNSDGNVKVINNSSIEVETISNDGNFENNCELTVKTLDNTNEFNNGNSENNAAILTVETLNNKYVDEFNYAAKFNNYAKLTVNGTLTNNGTITNGGSLIVGSVSNHTGELANTGTLENIGTLTINSFITNSGTLTNSGSITNYGKLTNNGTLNNNGTDVKSATIEVEEGLLTNAQNATLSINNYATLTAGDNVTNNGTISVNGKFEATYTYATITNNGTVNVEGQSAVINIANSVSNQSTGTFKMTNVALDNKTVLKNANIEFVEGTNYSQKSSTISGATLTDSKLTVNSGYTLEVTADLDLGNNGTLTNEGIVTFGKDGSDITLSGATLTNSGILSIQDNDIASFGTVTNSNEINVLEATLNATSFENQTGAKVNVEGKSDLTATVTGTGTFEMEGVQLTNATTLNGAIINFNGEGNQVKSSVLTDSEVTVNSGAELTLDGATTGDIINNGTLNLTGEVKAGEVTNEGTINMDDVDAKFYTETDELVINTTYAGNEVQRDEDDYGKYYYINDDYVAQVGETNYALLQAAIVAAGENGTVTIIAGEITESVTVSNNTTFVLGTDITAATINGKLTVDGTAEFNCAEIQFTNVDLSAGATMIIEEGNFEATSFATKGQKAKINVGVDAKLAMEVLRVQHSGASFEFNGEVNIAQVIADNNTNPYTIKLNAHDARLYTPTTGLNVTTDFVDNEYLTTSEGKNHRVSYKTEGSYYRLVNMLVAKVAGESTTVFTTIEEALALGGNLELLWEEGNDPIVMTGVLTNKNATITANSNNDSGMVVDWSEGRLYIGRMAAFNNGPATLTFDGVKFTSVNDNDADYGIFVSGRVKNSEHYNGTLVIKDSEVEISSIYNQNNTEIENSTVTFKTAKGVVVSGINAGDSPTGDMTTSTLDINNSIVKVDNITVGERGVGRVLVDVDLVENEFTPDNNGKSQIKVSTLNVLANGMLRSAGDIEGTIINAGDVELTGGIYTPNRPYDEWCHANYAVYQLTENSWEVRQAKGEQEINLTANWNWFSTYINNGEATNFSNLKNALVNDADMIKGQRGFVSNYGTAWLPGTLTTISTGEMYMIKMRDAKTIKLEGPFENYSTRTIELNEGWNWIGYPVAYELPVEVALMNFVPNEGDQIKGLETNELASYYGGKWWYTEDKFNLVPGHGYMYKSAAKNAFFYNAIDITNTNTGNRNSIDYHWNSDASQYPTNMSIIAMVTMDGEVVNSNYEVAAFANGELRGSARPVYVDVLDAYILMMNISGDEVEELTFKYYDVNYGTEYVLSNRINYSTDAVLGSMDEPYMLTLDILNIDEAAANEISIYPNPTTTDVEINLNATCDTVEVFNALGVKVAEYSNVDSIDALETAGVYVIRITNDGNVQNCRLVVK